MNPWNKRGDGGAWSRFVVLALMLFVVVLCGLKIGTIGWPAVVVCLCVVIAAIVLWFVLIGRTWI